MANVFVNTLTFHAVMPCFCKDTVFQYGYSNSNICYYFMHPHFFSQYAVIKNVGVNKSLETAHNNNSNTAYDTQS